MPQETKTGLVKVRFLSTHDGHPAGSEAEVSVESFERCMKPHDIAMTLADYGREQKIRAEAAAAEAKRVLAGEPPLEDEALVDPEKAGYESEDDYPVEAVTEQPSKAKKGKGK